MEKLTQASGAETAHYVRFQQPYDALKSVAYERLLDVLLKGGEGVWVLDLGAGSGAFGERLSARGYTVVEADLSFALLKAGRVLDEKNGRHWIEADALRLPFADNSVPVIILGSVLHHFQDLTPLVREVHRCLKPGGWCLSADPHGSNWMMWLLRHPRSPFCSTAGRSPNERWLGSEEVSRVFVAEGFDAARVVGVSGVTYRLATFCRNEENPPVWARALMGGWNLLEEILFRLPGRPHWLSSWMVFRHQKKISTRRG